MKLASFCPLVGLRDLSLTSWFPVRVRLGLLSCSIWTFNPTTTTCTNLHVCAVWRRNEDINGGWKCSVMVLSCGIQGHCRVTCKSDVTYLNRKQETVNINISQFRWIMWYKNYTSLLLIQEPASIIPFELHSSAILVLIIIFNHPNWCCKPLAIALFNYHRFLKIWWGNH